MKLVLAPIDPPQGELCWSVRFVNDGAAPVRELVIVSVDYEWGDQGNERAIGARFGPIAPGAECEVYRESDTEVRTSLTLKIDGKDSYVELGKLVVGKPARTFDL